MFGFDSPNPITDQTLSLMVYSADDRQAVKRAIYAKHGLRLIELGDAEIERLDDVLPPAFVAVRNQKHVSG